jgi:hypothetical protein
MLDKWNRRRHVQQCWEDTILALTNRAAIEALTEKDRKTLHASLVVTMTLYNKGACMNKQTLRLLFMIKRILADKRLYEDIKVLEYLMIAHTIFKRRMNKEVKERLIAHNLQMAQVYLEATRNKQVCNPFAPGQFLREEEK